MKKITEEHFVPAKTYTTTKYVACDGKEFTFEIDCLKYEAQLEADNHPVIKSRIMGASTFMDSYCANLFYISNHDDFEFLKEYIKGGVWNTDFEKYGAGWYLYWRVDGGDYADDLYLYNYLAYEKEQEEDLKNWKAEMRDLLPDNLDIKDDKR